MQTTEEKLEQLEAAYKLLEIRLNLLELKMRARESPAFPIPFKPLPTAPQWTNPPWNTTCDSGALLT